MYRVFWSHTQHDGFLLLLLGGGKEKIVGMAQQIVAKVRPVIFMVKCFLIWLVKALGKKKFGCA